MEELINKIYKELKENYDNVYPQVYRNYYENDYSISYVIILKDLDNEFRVYQAIRYNGKPIVISKFVIDEKMLRAMGYISILA